MLPYSRNWFAEIRELESQGHLRFTVREIAEREMKALSQRAIRYVMAHDEAAAYVWASLAAGCANELIRIDAGNA